MADSPALTLALALTESDCAAVIRAHSAENGYPKTCRRADGSPAPPGVPCTVERAADPEPIADTKTGKTIAYLYPAPVKSAVPTTVTIGTRDQCLAVAAAAAEPVTEKSTEEIAKDG